jgi:hypothetical protein
VAAWEALVRWIDDSGDRLVGDCRELCHEWHDEDASRNVMELQQPITRSVTRGFCRPAPAGRQAVAGSFAESTWSAE